MRYAADEELLRLKEEAEEKDRQRGNRKRDNRRRRRRRRRRLGKENETVGITDKGRKEGEQVDPVRRAEFRFKDPSPTRSLWERTIRDEKVKWVQHETTEEEERNKMEGLL